MTQKEAFEKIKDELPFESDIINEALAIIERACEKQIPKKVTYDKPVKVKAFDGENEVETYECYPCPICGKWIVNNEGHKFCEHCGQAIDWE